MNPWCITFYILFLLLDSSVAQYNQDTMGPFDIVFRHIGECPDVGLGKIRLSFKLHRVARNQFSIDANASSSIVIDDSYSLRLEAAKFGNGGWKENFFVKDFPKLSSIKYLVPKLAKDLSIAAGYPNEDEFPLKPKNYTVRNLKLTFELNHVIPIFVYGEYRADISLIKNTKVYGCFRLFDDMVPKRVNGRNKKKKTTK